MDAEPAHLARDNDPIAAAARALAQAMADAQEAIAAARGEQLQGSTALAESQQQSQALKAKVGHLEARTQRQRNHINALVARSGELATERDIYRNRASTRYSLIEHLYARLAFVESSRRGERLRLDTEHAELETQRAALKAGEAALKTEKTRLTREKNKLVKDQRAARSALAGIKRSVEGLESQLGEDAPPASPRKRRRAAAGPVSAPA